MCIYCTYRVYTVCSVWSHHDVWGDLGAAGTPKAQTGKGQGFVEIIISNSSNQPIYEQIVRQVKGQIMAGDLTAGEQLPSIRALANSLRVSAITTKRAYADLEAQGFIETVQGKGSFVAGGNAEMLREERLREIEERLLQAIEAGRALDLGDDELIEMMRTLLESDD